MAVPAPDGVVEVSEGQPLGKGELECVLSSLGGGCCESSANRKRRRSALRCKFRHGAGRRVRSRERRREGGALPGPAGRRRHRGCRCVDGRRRQPSRDRCAAQGRECGRRRRRDGERAWRDGSVRRRPRRRGVHGHLQRPDAYGHDDRRSGDVPVGLHDEPVHRPDDGPADELHRGFGSAAVDRRAGKRRRRGRAPSEGSAGSRSARTCNRRSPSPSTASRSTSTSTSSNSPDSRRSRPTPRAGRSCSRRPVTRCRSGPGCATRILRTRTG